MTSPVAAGVVRDLGRPTVRSVRWHLVPLAAMGVAALLWWQDGGLGDPVRAVWVLRGVAVLLAAAAAGSLVEPSRALLAPVPAPLWWRTGTRLSVAALPAALVWGAALAWVAGRSAGPVPVGALTVEAAAVLAVGLALGTGLARWRELDDPGVVAGPAVLSLGLLLGLLPPRLSLLVPPGPQWEAAHLRWGVLLGAALAVLAVSLRDPARRSPWPRTG